MAIAGCMCSCGGRVGRQSEADLSPLQGLGPSAAQQGAEAPREGEAAGRPPSATRSNETWAMDFVHDQLATGRKIRVLTIVDTFTRFSPAVDPRFSYRGEDVVLTLERICRSAGYPQSIRVDQGSEFIRRDLDLWAYQKGVVLDFSRPASRRTTASSSPSTQAPAECLNTHWFMSLDDARAKMEAWRETITRSRAQRDRQQAADRAHEWLSGIPAEMSPNPEFSSSGGLETGSASLISSFGQAQGNDGCCDICHKLTFVASCTPVFYRKGSGVGLRERKKDKTRADLLSAALDLFERQGFAETTINQIADAVDVSHEHSCAIFQPGRCVVSWVEDGMSVFLSSLANRPTDESPNASLIASARTMLAHYQSQSAFYLTIERAIASSSAIRARKLEMVFTTRGEGDGFAEGAMRLVRDQ